MIRAKAIVDAIFDSTEYEYETGGFFDTNLFRQLYVSGWGDSASPYIDQDQSENIFSAVGDDIQGSGDYLDAPVEISEPGNNYNNTTSTYTAPVNGNYSFKATCYYAAQQGTTGTPAARLRVLKNGALVAQGATGWNQTISVTWSGPLVVGDTIRIYIYDAGVNDGEQVTDQTFRCLVAPGDINVAAQFDCDYKQIDFIKDLLTTFRLVMAPDKINPKKFIIEPWVDYIATGDYYDWSDKIDRSKDLIIEPVFDTQTDIIYFDHTEDKDYINQYHIDAYKNIYGHLEFDSGNDLLKGSRNIKTGWAPTPMTQIEGAPDTNSFIIPQVHTHGAETDEHLPIKPKTRWLFYDGLESTDGYSWRLSGGPNSPYTYYPLVSYSNGWPITNFVTILNWFNDVGYWGDNVSGFPVQGGTDMYDKYWSGYINSLYNKDARRVTATFILNDVDLQNFTFDDIIFVDGNYYRPEQIIDAPIGERAPVKVQMLKLLTGRFRV